MPKKNAVVDSNISMSDDLGIPSLASVCIDISVHNSEDQLTTGNKTPHNVENFTEHSVEEIVLAEFHAAPTQEVASSASKVSISSGGSENTIQSTSSVGSVASLAVGTSASIKQIEVHKVTVKEIIKSLPSLFFGKKRPSFLLVLLVFMAIAVSAPAASTLILVTLFFVYSLNLSKECV